MFLHHVQFPIEVFYHPSKATERSRNCFPREALSAPHALVCSAQIIALLWPVTFTSNFYFAQMLRLSSQLTCKKTKNFVVGILLVIHPRHEEFGDGSTHNK